jgi:competence protein ComEC
VAGLALALGLAVLLVARRLRGAWAAALACGALALAAFGTVDLRASSRLADDLAVEIEGQTLVITGVVAGMPRLSLIGTAFEFEVESALHAGQPVRVPRRLSLGWYTGWDGEALMAGPAQVLVAGERWQLPVRLKRPHGVQNPHGFDLELSLFERGIRATGTVRPDAQRLPRGGTHVVERLRQAVRDAILLSVTDPTAAGVLAALAVGDQAAIEREDWDVFRTTGVAHLMSISGLHVTMFAWLATAAVAALWRRWPRAMQVWPAPDAARWGGLALAAAYALLAGWGVPAQRTVWMLATVTLLRSLGRRWPWVLVWLAAGTAVTVLDPWALLQPGFWLSFVAVGVLMASQPAGTRAPAGGWRARLHAGLRTQAVATVSLAPLTLVFFHQVSIVGALANLLAIPWVTLIVTPLALAGMIVPPLWQLGAWAVQALMAGLSHMAAWPWAVWSAAAAPAWAQIAGLAGGVLLVLPLPWRLRSLGIALVLPLLWPVVARVPEGQVEILVADVGQGTAVMLRTREHLMLYDAGPRYSQESDAAGRVLLPLLRARGESTLDLLVLSHSDTDHTGGASALLAALDVKASLSSLEDAHPLRARLRAHRRCEAGQAWNWDGVRFEVLHPLAEDYRQPQKPNAASCVIRVSDAQGPRLLLTGDIETPQELALLARHAPGQLRTPVLLAPHHGSRTSSSEDLLAAVAPQLAVVQAAYRSRFGHPATAVLDRYRGRGIGVLRSDECGAWHWQAGGAAASSRPGRCERELRRRYWHHRGTVPSASDGRR